MNENVSPHEKSFENRLQDIKQIADALPGALMIHRTVDLGMVYMNRYGLNGLGITQEELEQLTEPEFHVKFYNSDESQEYVPKILHIIRSKTSDQVSFFQQIRNVTTQEWQLYATNTCVFHRDEKGDPTHIITISGRIDPLHHITTKVNRLMAELSFLRTNNPLFLTLTKREKEVLGKIALGKTTIEIAESLFLSPATVETHRKNIRNKLNVKTHYDTVLFAQAYNLI